MQGELSSDCPGKIVFLYAFSLMVVHFCNTFSKAIEPLLNRVYKYCNMIPRIEGIVNEKPFHERNMYIRIINYKQWA